MVLTTRSRLSALTDANIGCHGTSGKGVPFVFIFFLIFRIGSSIVEKYEECPAGGMTEAPRRGRREMV